MTTETEPSLDPLRQQLLARLLGKYLTWQSPQIVEIVGPFNPAAFGCAGNPMRHGAQGNLVQKCGVFTERQSGPKQQAICRPARRQAGEAGAGLRQQIGMVVGPRRMPVEYQSLARFACHSNGNRRQSTWQECDCSRFGSAPCGKFHVQSTPPESY
jgi:hypothetical protein